MEVEMEIHVIKKGIVILFFFFNIQFLLSQRVEPVFIGPDLNIVSSNKDSLKLNFFLSNIANFDRAILNGLIMKNMPCYSGMGLFQFVVHQNTDVEVISYTGQLPQLLVETLKKRIEATRGMWIPEKRDGVTTHSYPILLFVTFNVIFGDCEKQRNTVNANQTDSEMGEQLARALQTDKKDNSTLIILPKGYLLPVLDFSAIE
jgi:hypothetical protein